MRLFVAYQLRRFGVKCSIRTRCPSTVTQTRHSRDVQRRWNSISQNHPADCIKSFWTLFSCNVCWSSLRPLLSVILVLVSNSMSFLGPSFEKAKFCIWLLDVGGELNLNWWNLALLRNELKERRLRMLWITLSGERPWRRGRRVGKHAVTRATPISIIGQNSIRLTEAGEIVSIACASYLIVIEMNGCERPYSYHQLPLLPKYWGLLECLRRSLVLYLTINWGQYWGYVLLAPRISAKTTNRRIPATSALEWRLVLYRSAFGAGVIFTTFQVERCWWWRAYDRMTYGASKSMQ